MSVHIIEQRLERERAQSAVEELHSLREITQELVLASLGRSDFFSHASFQGGTCLRIFHGLDRFSEDLDFSLLKPNCDFQWAGYLQLITRDLALYGYEIDSVDRSRLDAAVKLAFLKDDAIGKILDFRYAGRTGSLAKIRIKLEIDTNPPAGAREERRVIDFPFLSRVTVQDLPSLFAGKLHALLCREYLKGRDWFDFLWYTSRRIGVNYPYLAAALKQAGPYKDMKLTIDRSWLTDALEKRIKALDFERAALDVRRFIAPSEQSSLDLWSEEVFLAQVAHIS